MNQLAAENDELAAENDRLVSQNARSLAKVRQLEADNASLVDQVNTACANARDLEVRLNKAQPDRCDAGPERERRLREELNKVKTALVAERKLRAELACDLKLRASNADGRSLPEFDLLDQIEAIATSRDAWKRRADELVASRESEIQTRVERGVKDLTERHNRRSEAVGAWSLDRMLGHLAGAIRDRHGMLHAPDASQPLDDLLYGTLRLHVLADGSLDFDFVPGDPPDATEEDRRAAQGDRLTLGQAIGRRRRFEARRAPLAGLHVGDWWRWKGADDVEHNGCIDAVHAQGATAGGGLVELVDADGVRHTLDLAAIRALGHRSEPPMPALGHHTFAPRVGVENVSVFDPSVGEEERWS